MHFLNVPHTVESVGRLVEASGDAVPGLHNLPGAYRAAIAEMRPYTPSVTGITVSDDRDEWGAWLRANRVFENIFTGMGTTDDLHRQVWQGQLGLALRYLRDDFPGLGYMVDLLVTDLVLLTSTATGGGSASRLPGVVAMSPGANWGVIDFAETLVHEMTHLNLFVLDMTRKLYELPTDQLADHRHRVLSAVKVGELRPFDKAFHSAVVAVPLMYMQHARGDTTLVDAFADSLLDCCKGLKAKRHLFTPYGRVLLDELTGFAQTLDFRRVESGFTREYLAA